MKIIIARDGEFRPEWQGNTELPDAEQIVISYKLLSFEQRKKYIKKSKPKLTIDNVENKTDDQLDDDILGQHSRFEMLIDTDDDGIVAAMNPTISNLEDQDGNAIDTWAKLIKLPQSTDNQLEALIGEIMRELSGSTKEKPSKN